MKLSSALFHGWKKGLKTGSYYIRSKPAVNSQQFTIDQNVSQRESTDNYMRIPKM